MLHVVTQRKELACIAYVHVIRKKADVCSSVECMFAGMDSIQLGRSGSSAAH